MKLLCYNSKRENTTYLQGIAAWVSGTPAGKLKEGDTMVWNQGVCTKVGRVIKETDKTITIEDVYFCDYEKTEKVYVRKMRKDRIVARPHSELPA